MNKIYFLLILVLASVLRLYNLGGNPPSLYWDEASLGYNAYSILKSGMDEHGENYPLARFIAFGDYKPPGYVYASVPFIAAFGLNEYSVRAASSVAGILLVFVSYHLVRLVFRRERIALFASLLVAVSPWSIHLSRGAFEANLAATLNLLGIYFFVAARKKGSFVAVSAFFFTLAFYTFNSNRIISPLMYLMLYLIFVRREIKNLKWHVLSLIVTGIMLIPSLGFLRSPESRLRLQEVSIFNNLEPVLLSNSRIEKDGYAPVAKLIHNRRFLYASDYLKHFSDNFTGRFLFTHGDVNPRLHVGGMGQLYVIELPLILLGIFFLASRKARGGLILLVWMAVSVIPAAVARETPHALRIVSILPTYQIIASLGLWRGLLYLKQRGKSVFIFWISVLLSVFYVLSVFYYLHLYHLHFPVESGGQYQFGTKEMVSYVGERQMYYDRIFVTREIGRPYIFFAFYGKYDPYLFRQYSKLRRDDFGFWDVDSMDKIEFDLKNAAGFAGRALMVSNSSNLPSGYRLIHIIRDSGGSPYLYIGEKL